MSKTNSPTTDWYNSKWFCLETGEKGKSMYHVCVMVYIPRNYRYNNDYTFTTAGEPQSCGKKLS